MGRTFNWMMVLCYVGIVLLTAEPMSASQAVVVTKQGETLRGQVVIDDSQQITLLISGIRRSVERRDIEQIEYIKTVAEEFQEKKAALQNDDVDGYYTLLNWLVFEMKQYELAKAELEDLEKRFPENRDIRLLKTVTMERAKLDRKQSQRRRDRKSALPSGKQPQKEDDASELKDQHLTPDQITLIKVFEIDLKANPRVVVPREVIDDILIRYSADSRTPKGRNGQRELRRTSGANQLRFLFELSAGNPSVREYYSKVTVRGDPPAITTFRTTIHKNYVLNYCGAVQCHGGEGVGNFSLLRTRPNSDETVYTNFYKLHRTRTADGLIIDRDSESPSRSLLIQYGLNETDAATPHPPVPGWKPKILNTKHRSYERLIRWVESLWRPTPDYGFGMPEPTEEPTVSDQADLPSIPAQETPSPAP